MFNLLYPLVHAIQPYLVPICFVLAWSLVIMLGWSVWSALADTLSSAKKMHQIPCAGCDFFTADYRLKCTVHPSIANTEDAIYCSDYQAKK
ncbi:MAG TPA: hypothetical protein VIQ31_38275 [Phormidium sp.]